MVVDMDSLQPAVTPFLTCNKIQDGGRRPFWKKENRHISAAISVIFTTFGVLVAMVNPQRAVMSFLEYTKMAADRHFEKRKIAITRPPFELLSPNLARW